MEIKINLKTLQESKYMYMNDKKIKTVMLNGKETKFCNERFKFRVLSMVSNWPNELVDPDVHDGLEYNITIKQGKTDIVYKFKNKFPEDVFRIEELFSLVAKEV